MTYVIKCDECKAEIGTTESVRESAAGGWCDRCRPVTCLCGHFRLTHTIAGDHCYGIIGPATIIRAHGTTLRRGGSARCDCTEFTVEDIDEATRNAIANSEMQSREEHP